MSLEEIRGTRSGGRSGKENVRASQDLTWKKEKRLALGKKTHPIKKWAENLTFFFQRRQTDGQQVHEKVLNISNHQANGSQNHNEISPHTH